MKLKRYQNFLLENSTEMFSFAFEQQCEECSGTGIEIEDTECVYCSGSGISDLGEEDENGMYHKDDECDWCEGEGFTKTEATCQECFEGKLKWIINFKQGKGVEMMHEEYGNSDFPIQYDDGRIGYDHSGAYPDELRQIVEHIFNNKDLGTKEIVNSVARFMFENKILDLEMNQEMIDLFDSQTKTLAQSYSVVNKFNI